MKIDDHVKHLITYLTKTVSLLKACHEEQWSVWLQRCLDDIHQRNFDGIKKLIDCYGGMGSFSDLILHPMNGHTIEANDVNKCNEQLVVFRTEIYTLATEIRHSAKNNDPKMILIGDNNPAN